MRSTLIATRTKKPAKPTEEEIAASGKETLLELITVHELEIEPKGKRVAELRDEVLEAFYPTPDDDDEDEDEEEAEPTPAKKPAAKASAKKKTSDGDEPNWEDLLKGLDSQNGDVQFLKGGRTQVRLVLEDDDDKKSWYAETVRVYRGERRTKYLIRALMLKSDPPAVKAIPVAKSVLKSIVQLLVEGYELFDAKEGHGLTLVKSGSGLETGYNVMPSPKPVPLPKDFTDLEATLEDLATSLTEQDINRSNKEDDDDEDEKPKARRGRGAQPATKSKRRPAADDDDDDEDGDDW